MTGTAGSGGEIAGGRIDDDGEEPLLARSLWRGKEGGKGKAN